MADDVPGKGDSHVNASQLADELSKVHKQLSIHADQIEKLQNEDGAIREHLQQLDQAVQGMRSDIDQLTHQSARTESSLNAFREVQATQHESLVGQLLGMREDIKESMAAAVKSTPASVKMVLTILSVLAAFMMLAVVLSGHHPPMP